jgi:diguanylate cyclase (GGDEF)-like protein/PAS domain S-box-containing protein
MLKVTKGDLDVKIEVKSNDEFGELADSFNKMIKDLKVSKEQVKQYSKTLEQSVERRTKELQESLDNLEDGKRATLNILEDVNEAKGELSKTKEYLESLIGSVVDPIITTDIKGKILSFSKGAETLLGYCEQEVIGTHISRFYVGGIEDARKIMEILREQGKLQNYEMLFLSKDNKVYPSILSASFIRNGQGEVIGTIGIAKDISDRKELEDELKDTKDFLESIVDSPIDGITVTDESGRIKYVSRGAEEMLGYMKENIPGTHVSKYYIGGLEEAINIMKVLREEERLTNYETKVKVKGGGLIPIIASFSRLENENKEVIGTLGVFKDITEKKKLENEIIETKEYLENLLENANDIVCTIDLHGNFTYVNQKIEEMGYKKDKLIGKSFFSIMSKEFSKDKFRESLLKSVKQAFEVEIKDMEGNIRNALLSTSPLYNSQGNETGLLVLARDITDRKEMEQELEKLSITDNLTGLYNQRHFYTELKREIDRSLRVNRILSLILFDLDKFKLCNDNYGHLEGDRILSTVGKVVSQNIRENVDSGFRYGGDEFMVILPEANKKEAFTIAERIRESFNKSEVGDVTLSIGLVEYNPEYDLDTLIKIVDETMYLSKKSGGNRISIYE